ncbi:hypothetical protein [Deinococcus kurensis]|uniref:hypothetical protein n=1 Tax=Deinococcus kurensis TaxID=2662757 RepID=UPI0012D2C9BC|nr:hypothetical protein [Deinococcus kurensis]
MNPADALGEDLNAAAHALTDPLIPGSTRTLIQRVLVRAACRLGLPIPTPPPYAPPADAEHTDPDTTPLTPDAVHALRVRFLTADQLGTPVHATPTELLALIRTLKTETGGAPLSRNQRGMSAALHAQILNGDVGVAALNPEWEGVAWEAVQMLSAAYGGQATERRRAAQATA